MHRSFLILLLFVTIASCNNKDENNTVLDSPPFAALTDSIKATPNNAELYYKRGVLLFQNNQVSHAESDVEQAWKLSPKEEYALSLANLKGQKNRDSAIVFLESALQKLPQSIALKIDLAKAYQTKNEAQKALTICDSIIAKYPGQLDALLLKAEILEAQNKPAEALVVLEQAYNYAPSDVELVHKLAFNYAETKNKKALALSDSLIKADMRGTHAEPYLFKGIYYQNIKAYPAALNQFDQAIVKDYNNLDVHMYKGQTLFEQKKYNEAIAALKLATTITPTYADAYYWIGKAQEALNNKEEAKLNYERAYQLDKELVEAKEAAERI